MSVQTEIKNEKELFEAIGAKIKRSKTLKHVETKEYNVYQLDTFNILLEKGNSDDDFVFIVKDKQNKVIVKRNCGIPDVEGEALTLCKARFAMWEKLMGILNDRIQQEKDRQAAQEELKQAAARLKATKKLRQQQLAEAATAMEVLKKIKSL